MRLCDRDIIKAFDEGYITVDPRPPLESVSGVSVDLRLGNRFRTFSSHTTPFIDLSGSRSEVDEAIENIMSEEIVVDDAKEFFLHPGELALGITYESVTLPDDIVAWLDGRSSLARLGLMVHVTAHRIDPAGVVILCWNSLIRVNCHLLYARVCRLVRSALSVCRAQLKGLTESEVMLSIVIRAVRLQAELAKTTNLN